MPISKRLGRVVSMNFLGSRSPIQWTPWPTTQIRLLSPWSDSNTTLVKIKDLWSGRTNIQRRGTGRTRNTFFLKYTVSTSLSTSHIVWFKSWADQVVSSASKHCSVRLKMRKEASWRQFKRQNLGSRTPCQLKRTFSASFKPQPTRKTAVSQILDQLQRRNINKKRSLVLHSMTASRKW